MNFQVGDQVKNNVDVDGWTFTIIAVEEHHIRYNMNDGTEINERISKSTIVSMVNDSNEYWTYIPVSSSAVKNNGGMNCKGCNEFNEYGQANVGNDYICYGCRNRP